MLLEKANQLLETGPAAARHGAQRDRATNHRKHPGLSLELQTETSILDLSRREADVALRLVRPKEPALVARHLGELPLGIFASEAYLKRRGTPRTLAAAASHDWIGYGEACNHYSQVRWLHRVVRSPRYVLRASTLTTQMIACAEGIGLALLPVFCARNEPRIAQLFTRHAAPSRDLWGVFHTDLRVDARISIFFAWVTAVLRDHLRRPR